MANTKVKQKRILPSCPAQQDPLGVIAAERRAGSNILPAGTVPPPDMVLGRRGVDAFWGALPWGEAQLHFTRTHLMQPPPAGVVNLPVALPDIVPGGQVLAITSIVFRALIQLDGNLTGYVRDDFFTGIAGFIGPQVYFNPLISGRSPTNASVSNTNFTDNTGYYLLNQNIADSQVPFVIFAQENQAVSCVITAINNATTTAMLNQLQAVGYEIEGMFMPKQLYSKLRREFHA